MTRTLVIAAALLAFAQAAPAQTPVAAPQPVPETAPTETAPEAPSAEQPETPPAAPHEQPVSPPSPPAAQQAAAPAQPAPAPAEKVPLRKKLYGWGSVGTTFAYGETYGSANLGVGYQLKAGITPNVEASYMFGNSPTIWALRPGVTWYSRLPFKPYLGAYYTHWFVGNGFSDQNGVGGRAGLSILRVMQLGVTYDRAFNCSKNCDAWSPQISAGVSL